MGCAALNKQLSVLNCLLQVLSAAFKCVQLPLNVFSAAKRSQLPFEKSSQLSCEKCCRMLLKSVVDLLSKSRLPSTDLALAALTTGRC